VAQADGLGNRATNRTPLAIGRKNPAPGMVQSLSRYLKGRLLFEITFLGTSASAPSVHRGLSAHVIAHNEHRFLVDCGEGTQRQILQSGLGFKRLERILITHGHLDHILGLAGLVSTFLRWEAIDRLEIWAGRWALDRIQRGAARAALAI
jgi:ribonuclease Z